MILESEEHWGGEDPLNYRNWDKEQMFEPDYEILFRQIAQAIREAEARGLNKAREALELVSKMERDE